MPDHTLNIDPEDFAAAFDRVPIRVSHALGEHPLLQVESVAKLAEGLPEDSIEHNLGNLPTVVDPNAVEQSDMPVGEIARTIDTNGCWMVLKNIEQNPAYDALLNELLDEVKPMVDRDGGMNSREGFIFLSAPDSVTPSHTDPEHNFLLQVRGEKDMNVGEYPDASTRQLELEQTFGGGGNRNIEWEPAQPADLQAAARRRRLRSSPRPALGAERARRVGLALDHLPDAGQQARDQRPRLQLAAAADRPLPRASRPAAGDRQPEGQLPAGPAPPLPVGLSRGARGRSSRPARGPSRPAFRRARPSPCTASRSRRPASCRRSCGRRGRRGSPRGLSWRT